MASSTTSDPVAALLHESAETHSTAQTDEPWPNFYARHLREQFASS
jgi:hypothetical protein